MVLVPFYEVTIVSTLDKSTVISRLSEYLEPFQLGSEIDPSKLLNGKVNEEGFSLSRVYGKKNVKPIIKGRFEQRGKETILLIKMKPFNIVSIVFSAFYCFIIYRIFTFHEFNSIYMLITIYFVFIFFFNNECDRATKQLQEILQGP